MNTYLWILLGSLFVQSSLCVKSDTADSKLAPSAELLSRRPRQNIFRGNARFQLPLQQYHSPNPDHYAREVYSHDNRGSIDGSYDFAYETENGIKRKEESIGYGPNKVVRGFYSHVGPDGRVYTTRYIADRFGYRAYGAHLPTQPDELFEQTRFPLEQPPPRPFVPPVVPPVVPDYAQQQQFYPRPHPLPAHHLHQQPDYSNNYDPSDRFDNNVTPPPHHHHHHPQHLPSQSFQSRPIYVQEPSSSPNYVSITPRPIAAASTPGHLPPQAAYLQSNGQHYGNYDNHYSHQPEQFWTTAKPHYGASSRPY